MKVSLREREGGSERGGDGEYKRAKVEQRGDELS